ncbi:hypothetical protein AC249_AIPGENE13119 [Exaiptasia diaphana]|nr:hypothetical protein AC249_AIPGENE13119 [Exaiptasia diaphana]
MKTTLVVLLLIGLASSLSVRKKRHENEGKKDVVTHHDSMVCLPLQHPCNRKKKPTNCCSGYCGVARGPGNAAIMQALKTGICSSSKGGYQGNPIG